MRRTKLKRSTEAGSDYGFKRLKAMKSFQSVDQMVRDGRGLTEIVEFIKSTGEYDGVTDSALRSIVSSYRSSLSPGELVSLLLPRQFLAMVDEWNDKVSALNELERLYMIQAGRIEKFVQKEETLKFPMPMKGVAREIDVGRQILVDIEKLRLDMGIDERNLGKLTLQAEVVDAAETKFGQKIARVVANPESRRKVLTIFDRVEKRLTSGQD
jgi:hypothetical protein